MSFRRNPERERLVYRYWVQGHTIDEISRLTGIPRSSVGYYVRKFNRRYGEGRLRRKRSLILMDMDEGSKMNEVKLVESAVSKMIGLKGFFDIIDPLVRQGRYRDLYYLLRSMKLMGEMLQPLIFTPEERKVADKAAQQFIQIITESTKLKHQTQDGEGIARNENKE